MNQMTTRPREALVLTNTDYADTPYDVWAANSDITLHLLVSSDHYDGYAHLPNAYSYDNYATNARIEMDAWQIIRATGTQALIARCEPDILRAARLRDRLGLHGQGWESALAFRDKVVMKEHLVRAGLPVPRFRAIKTAVDLVDFIDKAGYPAVLKPVTGSGSYDTSVLRNHDDLLAALERGMTTPMEVEQYIDGRMYVLDGLLVDGELLRIHPSRYINGCLSFQTGDYLATPLLTAKHRLYGRLVDFGRQVLEALPTPDTTTFHIEVFHTAEDGFVVCEAASRTGGGRTVSTIRHAFGIDLDHEWFNAQLGLAVTAGPAEAVTVGPVASEVLFYPRVGTLCALPDDDPPPFVVDSVVRGKLGQTYGGGYKSGHYLAGYVVEAFTDAELTQRVSELATWFDHRVRWI